MAWGAIGALASGIGGQFFDAYNERQGAAKQRQWALDASSTAYRRAMTDLKLAGLNPILAAQNPASTPSGAVGGSTGAGAAMPQAVNSAVNLQAQKTQIEKTKVERERQNIDLQLEKDMLKFYKENRDVQGVVNSAQMAHKVGIRPEILALYGAGRSLGKSSAFKNLLEKGYSKLSKAAQRTEQNRVSMQKASKDRRLMEQLKKNHPVRKDQNAKK